MDGRQSTRTRTHNPKSAKSATKSNTHVYTIVPTLSLFILVMAYIFRPELGLSPPWEQSNSGYIGIESLKLLASNFKSYAESEVKRNHPVILFKNEAIKLNLSSPDSIPPVTCTDNTAEDCTYAVGGYLEKRFIYTTDLFTSSAATALIPQTEDTYIYSGVRNVHIGVDVMCPADTSVYSFTDGVIESAGYNTAAGDYGGVVIVKYDINGRDVWVLYGHLNRLDAEAWKVGDSVKHGQIIARIGSKKDNGGWEPHLHLQVQVTKPRERDMPGVVSERDLERATEEFPCPMKLLGEAFEC